MSAARRCLIVAILAILTGLIAGMAAEAGPAGIYGQLPLSFEANRGQTDPAVGFVARSTGYQLFLAGDEAVLMLRRPGARAADTLRMSLVGAHPQRLQGSDPLPGTVNYLTGSDPGHWRTSIPTFAKVRVPEVYRGIDLVYYGHGRQLEYDFILAPGADPASIRMSIRGQAKTAGPALALASSGDLTVRAPAGDLLLKRPVAYQVDDDGTRYPVEVAYALVESPASGDRLIGFTLGAYDRSRALIIDPVLSYSTYLGGSAEDAGMAIAVRDGGVYVTGYTDSLNFALAGVQPKQPGQDAFVAKLRADGTGLVYATYLGGNGDDAGLGIAVDAAGQAHITGDTNSTNFPTVPLGNPLFGPQGGRDAFVAKLNADGTALVYSTYLGGDADDTGLGIALDAAGSAHVTGWTDSLDFPVTVTAFQGDQPGRDAFVAKLSPAGTALTYSTYLGGDGSDESHAIALDATGNAYITGGTTSANLAPTGLNPRQLAGGQDAFVAKLDPAASGGASRPFLTYLGGSGEDAGRGIAVDSTGLIYVTGSTAFSSVNFPIRATTASQAVHGGGQDAFVTKLNPAGLGPNQHLMYSTFLGGSGDEAGYAIAVDEEGQVYVAGFTTSANFPTRNAADLQLGGAKDAFVAKFDPLNVGAPSLRYATYLGGSGEDEAYGVALDASSNAYVAGLTRSGDFPGPAGSPGAAGSLSGPEDAFVARLSEPDLVVSVLTVPATAGAGDVIPVTAVTRNNGEAGADASTTSFYLSTDNKLNVGVDTFLGSYAVDPLAPRTEHEPLASPLMLTLPTGLPPATYFLFAMADATDVVGESLESNNKTKKDIVIGPDLTVSSLSVSSMGTTLTVTDTTRNAGGAAAVATATSFFLSGPGLIGEVPLGSRAVGPLPGGAPSGPTPTDVQIPAGTAVGSYTVIARADNGNAVLETSETNNATTTPFDVGVDLVAATLGDVPSITGAGKSFQVRATILNRGFIKSTVSTVEFFLSTTAELNPSAVSLGTRATPALDPGETSGTLSTTVTIPPTTTAGSYFVVVKANGGPSPIAETRTTNNTRSKATLIGPDLVISFVSPATLTTGPGGTVTFKDTTRNLGGGDSPVSLTKFYLSIDTLYDAADVELGQRQVKSLSLRENDFNSAGVPLTVPQGTAAGSYFIIARANAGPTPVGETNTTNNTATAALTVAGVDLEVLTLTVALGPNSTVIITDVTKNRGTVQAAASVTRFHLSTDGTFDEADTALGERLVGTLAGGATSEGTTTVTLPAGTLPGEYFIFARADAGNAVTESDEGNNRRSRGLDTRGSDLIVTNLVTAWDSTVRTILNVSDTTRNEGPATSGASTTQLYLSTDSTLDPGDTRLGPGRSVISLAAATHSTGTTAVPIPAVTAPGDYFIIARADDGDTVGEVNETNNVRTAPVSIRPDLLVNEFNVPATAVPGASVRVQGSVRNDGPIPAGTSTLKVFLSVDANLDAGDPPLLPAPLTIEALTPGQTGEFDVQVTLPADVVESRFIIAKIDPDNQIVEGNETNNTRSKSVAVGADLVVLTFTGPSPSAAAAGSAITVRDTVRNRVAEVGPTTVRVYLSTDDVLGPGDIEIGSRPVGPIGVNKTNAGETSVTIPSGTASGSYFIIAMADADRVVAEGNEGNNTNSFVVTVGADLMVTAVGAPAAAGAGVSITVTDTTTNVAGIEAPASTTSFYLSTNDTWDPADVLLDSRTVGPLGPGAASPGSITLTIPAGTAIGTYYVIARADANGVVNEVSETNNALASQPIVFGVDLTVTVSVPSTTGPGSTIIVKDVVTNMGGAAAGESALKFFLSPGNTLLGSRLVPGLAGGAVSEGATPITVPVDASSGVFFIVARVDADGQVTEVNEANNTATEPLRTAPDLRVENLTAPTEAAPGTVITIKDTTKNLGALAGPTETRFYLSVDEVLGPGDFLLGGRTVEALTFGKADLGSTDVTLPETIAAGVYHIIARADATEVLAEALEDNNTRSRTINIGPDFTITNVTAPTASGAGKTIEITAFTKNLGAPAGASATLFYLSSDEVWSASDRLLGSAPVPPLGSNVSKTVSATVTLPADVQARIAPYFIIAKANGDGAVGEANLTNNTRARAITLGPDYVVSALVVQTTGGAGTPFQISDTIRNDGEGDAPASLTAYYLSPTGALNSDALFVGTREVPLLGPGASDARTFMLTLPAGTPGGTYQLFAVANFGGLGQGLGHPEINPNNNLRSKQTKIGSDLVIPTLSAPGTVGAGSTISVTATVTNQGAGNAGTFAVRLYLSTDDVFQLGTDTEVGSRTFVGGLTADTSSGPTAINATIPAGLSGSFTLIAVADPENAISELSEINNQKTRSLNVQ